MTIFKNETTYNPESIHVLKNIMLADDSTDIKIYGKTGTYRSEHGWFVGFSENQGHKTYFALYLDDKKHVATGKKAKEIAIKLMKQKY